MAQRAGHHPEGQAGEGTSLNVVLDAQQVTRHILQRNAVRWNLEELQLVNGTR